MPMTKREAEKLINEHGGRFVRNGGNHDIWETADGAVILVPRHPGDLSTGVEKKIKGALGIQ